MKTKNKLTRKEAIAFLEIEEKHFDNYHKSSGEINGEKIKGRWCFDKKQLKKWQKEKNQRVVYLTIGEYTKCFEFAIKMAYSVKSSHGTGIRGVRSEMQTADDFILGILAEFGVQKFLKDQFNIEIDLDMEAHPDSITAQDFTGIIEEDGKRDIKIDVAVKSSKWKSCWNVIPPIEYENRDRKSDIYIFVRVGLPSDHLFRILRNHSFFKRVSKYLIKNEEKGFRKINELDNIPIWICGYSYHKDLKKVESIPGLNFDGYRYVASVNEMKNKNSDWKRIINRF
ncbi:hypothetical protein [Xanthomarina sp. F2636L]|uniref:hypothetical protein n=1 Tax=Xanthomarina sp. F2636L TaxID=2996018 RepID=UPI00225DF665|nr:hypothetical protein [Xanthomarina sp. F2636L]MCX7550884.1 hypothetical protein [Xanthomarina sp. F2636L]